MSDVIFTKYTVKGVMEKSGRALWDILEKEYDMVVVSEKVIVRSSNILFEAYVKARDETKVKKAMRGQINGENFYDDNYSMRPYSKIRLEAKVGWKVHSNWSKDCQVLYEPNEFDKEYRETLELCIDPSEPVSKKRKWEGPVPPPPYVPPALKQEL